MNLDALTASIKRAIDVLFLFNPRATSVGILVGVAAHGFKSFLGLELYHLIAAGILLCNMPSLLSRRRELPKEIEDALEVIRRSRDSLSTAQIRMQYLALVDQATRRVSESSRPPKPASTVGA
jgi:hypothetical protein